MDTLIRLLIFFFEASNTILCCRVWNSSFLTKIMYDVDRTLRSLIIKSNTKSRSCRIHNPNLLPLNVGFLVLKLRHITIARLWSFMTVLLDEFTAIGPGSINLWTYYSFVGNFKVLQKKVTHNFSPKNDNVF